MEQLDSNLTSHQPIALVIALVAFERGDVPKMVQGAQEKVFFTIHCNHSLANIAVRDLQNLRKKTQYLMNNLLFWVGNFHGRGVWIWFVMRGWIRIRSISDQFRNPAWREHCHELRQTN